MREIDLGAWCERNVVLHQQGLRRSSLGKSDENAPFKSVVLGRMVTKKIGDSRAGPVAIARPAGDLLQARLMPKAEQVPPCVRRELRS